MTFCNDVDLLYWEPDVLKEAIFVSQLQAQGTGDLGGQYFTATTPVNLYERHIEPGQVLALSGAVAGCFPITAVVTPNQVRISALYTAMFPAAGEAPASVGPLTVEGIAFAVRTFWAQRSIVSGFVLAALGLSDEQGSAVLNPEALRRPTALGTLQMIYSALAAGAAEPAKLNQRADLYERLYRRALRQTQVELDTDGDGIVNLRKDLGVIGLIRD